MIYIITEVKGYVTVVLEGEPGHNLVEMLAKFQEPIIAVRNRKPEWDRSIEPNVPDRHVKYKSFQQANQEWNDELNKITKQICGDHRDISEAFAHHLVALGGFKIHEFEQAELS